MGFGQQERVDVDSEGEVGLGEYTLLSFFPTFRMSHRKDI